jgi:hypothetical protein
MTEKLTALPDAAQAATDTATDTENRYTTINGRKAVRVQLETPIERKGETITAIDLMKPRTGDLRGLMLADLIKMNADAVAALLPRISVPTLTKHEIEEIDTADLLTCSAEVFAFLMPKLVEESPTA